MPVITVGGTGTTSAGNTFGDMIEKVYRNTLGAKREKIITLANAIGSNDTTVHLAGPQTSTLAPGFVLGVELEMLYVQDWNSSTGVATVIRGYYNSVPATHADNSTVVMNPAYSRYDISVEINNDLRSLSSPTNGLYRVGVAEVTWNPVFQGYDLGALPNNFVDILEVRYKIAPPYRTYPPIRKWKVLRQVPDSDFPSGQAIVFYEAGWPGLPVYITYSAPFIPLVNVADDPFNTPASNDPNPPYNGYSTGTVANLPNTAYDLPPLGAEIALVAPREIGRNSMESQPDPRKAADVPAGAVGGSINALIARRNARISEESDRLKRQYTKVRGW